MTQSHTLHTILFLYVYHIIKLIYWKYSIPVVFNVCVFYLPPFGKNSWLKPHNLFWTAKLFIQQFLYSTRIIKPCCRLIDYVFSITFLFLFRVWISVNKSCITKNKKHSLVPPPDFHSLHIAILHYQETEEEKKNSKKKKKRVKPRDYNEWDKWVTLP